ncbi:MAG: hypothetical protein ACPGVU_02610 [Limisphaerales bacterium]
MRILSVCVVFLGLVSASAAPLKIATFEADVTPPIGAPLCNGNISPVKKIVAPLSARGVVLVGSGRPIVLCSFDWVGIGNAAHDDYRERLAKAVGTSADRVTVHTIHQHDAPAADYSVEELIKTIGLGGYMFDPEFARAAIADVAKAARASLKKAQPVTHVGVGKGRVEKVASNRRILGGNGRVKIVRFSSSRNPAAIAAPEGVIDPFVELVSFWNGDQPLASITHYATHPQSYYGKGGVNPDFPGMARGIMEKEVPAAAHIHFAGAGGNVGAGKYNDGSPERRPLLAARLAKGMKLAWTSQKKTKIDSDDIGWSYVPLSLPVRDTITEESRGKVLLNEKEKDRNRVFAARDLVFLRRTKAGHKININCLRVGSARIVYMPGELFVEYQLAAQKMRPDLFVTMAAYGQYAPGYIGTKISYSQGGYETGRVSRVAPEVEELLLKTMRSLLAIE